jgi:N-formylglutamate amidohydrolase
MVPLALLGFVWLPWHLPAEKLVRIHVGALPIVLSAPHGGRIRIPDCPDRKGNGVNKFVIVNDTNSDVLALKVAAAIETKFGKPAHLVMAYFERKQCDANRPAADAYENKLAQPVYNRYHAALAAAKRAIEMDFGRGILIDLHGQAADAKLVFRGTNDLKTVTHLVDRFGLAAITGPKSVLGGLVARGHATFPALTSIEKERASFSGGYIVQTYGSRDGGAVDAIQLELGFDQRAVPKMNRFAADLADALHDFAIEYLPAKK